MLGCEPFTPEQEKMLLDHFKGKKYAERNIALLTFGIQTGFRIAEILSLTIGDVLRQGKIVDNVYVQRKNMKGGKSTEKKTYGRSMILAKRTKVALQTLIDSMECQDPDQYLFQGNRDGNTPFCTRSVWRLLSQTAKKLGITSKIGTHSMRKTFANRVYQNLLDKNNADALRIVQAGLGHENINNTIKYLSFREDKLNQAINEVFG